MTMTLLVASSRDAMGELNRVRIRGRVKGHTRDFWILAMACRMARKGLAEGRGQ